MFFNLLSFVFSFRTYLSCPPSIPVKVNHPSSRQALQIGSGYSTLSVYMNTCVTVALHIKHARFNSKPVTLLLIEKKRNLKTCFYFWCWAAIAPMRLFTKSLIANKASMLVVALMKPISDSRRSGWPAIKSSLRIFISE